MNAILGLGRVEFLHHSEGTVRRSGQTDISAPPWQRPSRRCNQRSHWVRFRRSGCVFRPTADQVMIAKYAAHLRLYLQEKSSPAPDSRSRVPPWRTGWVLEVCNCNLWSMPCAKWCSLTTWCAPTKRRYRCGTWIEENPSCLSLGLGAVLLSGRKYVSNKYNLLQFFGQSTS